MINHNGKEYKRESVYIYVCVCIYIYTYIYICMHTKKNIYILTKEYIYITESLCCTDAINTITLNQLYFNLINKDLVTENVYTKAFPSVSRKIFSMLL